MSWSQLKGSLTPVKKIGCQFFSSMRGDDCYETNRYLAYQRGLHCRPEYGPGR